MRKLRIYLDQNKWIDLARAATGRQNGQRFAGALHAARSAVARGLASFPLDLYRYEETTKRSDPRSRNDVVDVMLELSLLDSLALADTVLPDEIDSALNRRFGRPDAPQPPDIFGLGLRHVMAGRLAWPRPSMRRLSHSERAEIAGRESELEGAWDRQFEETLFRLGPESGGIVGIFETISRIDAQYVEHENSIAASIEHQGLSGAMFELAVYASDLGGIRTVVTDRLERAGMSWVDFERGLTEVGVRTFINDLPTRHVTNVMRLAKLRQTEQKWEPNDFNDMLALPMAIVYCDVVVTEKQWAHRLRSRKVDKQYDTVVLTDVADLVPILDRLVVSQT